MKGDIVLLKFNDVEILGADDGLVSLTTMWRANGKPSGKRPANWARKEGRGFIEHMARVLNVPVGHIIQTTRGKCGETRVHWQVGVAYAKDLSHRFHEAVNEGFLRHYQEAVNPDLKLDRAVDALRAMQAGDDWITARVAQKLERKTLTDRMRDHGCEAVGPVFKSPYFKATNLVNKAATGLTTQKLKNSRGVAKRSNARELMTPRELNRVTFLEAEAGFEIAERNAQGNDECVAAVQFVVDQFGVK